MPPDSRRPAREPSDRGSGRRGLLLRLLRDSGAPRSVADLADELGVHPNTVRFHLDALIDAGRVERVLGQAGGPGRPPIGYRLSVGMDRNGPTNYRLLATMLTGHLAASTSDPSRAATELGRAWGPALLEQATASAPAATTHAAPRRLGRSKAVARMVDVLAGLGFEPEPPAGSRTTEIRLRHCPFIDLVDDHAEVVCALHLGLMRGAFAAMNNTVTVERLVQFEQPDRCVAHLASTEVPA